MITIENYKVSGWEHAITGMRNPKNSWHLSDSSFYGTAMTHVLDENGKPKEHTVYYDALDIGPNDHKLAMRLVKGGPVHAKFRRMITVYVDITAPLYWWKEFDTYKVGTVANSCSTMHKIHDKEFTLDDFSHEHLFCDRDNESCPGAGGIYFETRSLINDDFVWMKFISPKDGLELIIKLLNKNRDAFLNTNDKKYWWQMIQLLPSSYRQKRTIMFNYETLSNIYKWRRHHKMGEAHWDVICDWIEELPYSEFITTQPGHNVLYLCDGKACEFCNNMDCLYTADVSHAKNFKEDGCAYWETEPVIVDTTEDLAKAIEDVESGPDIYSVSEEGDDFCEACAIDFGEE